jgi:hypothetical protein
VTSFLVLVIFPSGVRSPFDFSCSRRPGLRTALGQATNRAETLQAAYNSSEQELVELRTATLEACQTVEEARHRPEVCWPAICAPSAGTSPGACVARST